MSIDSISPTLPGMLPKTFILPGLGHPKVLRKRLTPDLKPRLRLPGLLNLEPNSSAKIVLDELPKDSNEASNRSDTIVQPHHKYVSNIRQTTKETSTANLSGHAPSNMLEIRSAVLSNGRPIENVLSEKRKETDKTSEGNNERRSISEYVRCLSTLQSQHLRNLIWMSVLKEPIWGRAINKPIHELLRTRLPQNLTATGEKTDSSTRRLSAWVTQRRKRLLTVPQLRPNATDAQHLSTINEFRVNLHASEPARTGINFRNELPPTAVSGETESSLVSSVYPRKRLPTEWRNDDTTTGTSIYVNPERQVSETTVVQQFYGANESEIRATVEDVLLELVNAANSRI
ncbi:MAG: hypothetical protein KF744_03090 [Taibaiella sp.]|nr:hypothetical protein [Taibaiella sp.]